MRARFGLAPMGWEAEEDIEGRFRGLPGGGGEDMVNGRFVLREEY